MRRLHIIAVVVTIVVHATLIGAVWALSSSDRQKLSCLLCEELAPDHPLSPKMCRVCKGERDEYVMIEAGLAAKEKVKAGTKKTKLKPKDVTPKEKPAPPRKLSDPVTDTTDTPAGGLAAPDPTAKKADPTAKGKKQRTADPTNVDYEAVAKGARDKRTTSEGEEMTDSDKVGTDDENKAGSPDGSEFGMLKDAKGDPYVAELIGRMTVKPDFVVPTTVQQGTGLVTHGCVQLEPSGKIKERKLDPDKKSRSHAFNSAVLDRLQQTSDMEDPVPKHLLDLLTEHFACVPYRY